MASAWKWEMYSLINTVCTGADLKTEQNWLETWRRQGRKTKFMHNCHNFFLQQNYLTEVSVTLCSKLGELSPSKLRLLKRQCQISPSLFFPSETGFVGFGGTWCDFWRDSPSADVMELPQGQSTPHFLPHTPDNSLLSLKSYFPFQLLDIRVNVFEWVLVLKVKDAEFKAAWAGFPFIAASPCSLICLLSKMRGASTEYERNSALTPTSYLLAVNYFNMSDITLDSW